MKIYFIYSTTYSFHSPHSPNVRLTFSKEEAEKSKDMYWTYKEIEIDEYKIPTETLETLQEVLIKRKRE
jgi:hypothetical protein